MNRITSLLVRLLFVASFALVALVAWEKLANLVGYTTVVGGLYDPWRLLQVSGVALLFVIALLLRGILHALQKKG